MPGPGGDRRRRDDANRRGTARPAGGLPGEIQPVDGPARRSPIGSAGWADARAWLALRQPVLEVAHLGARTLPRRARNSAHGFGLGPCGLAVPTHQGLLASHRGYDWAEIHDRLSEKCPGGQVRDGHGPRPLRADGSPCAVSRTSAQLPHSAGGRRENDAVQNFTAGYR